MDEVVLRMVATEDIEELGIRRGDLLTWKPGASEHPFVQIRHASFDYGALLVALNTGRLEALVTHAASSPGALASAPAADAALEQAVRPQLRLHRTHG